MFRAFLYKDIVLLRHRGRSFLLLLITMLATIGLLAVGNRGTGALLFGIDFIRLLLLSLVGLAAFLEHYANSLFTDKRDGILTIVLLSGRNPLVYFAAKVIIPLIIAMAASALTTSAYLIVVSNEGFSGTSLRFFLAVIASELFLAMGLGMALNIIGSVDIRTNPNIVIPMVITNVPLLYFVNPTAHLAVFCVVAICLGLVAYVVSLIFIAKRYRVNLG